MLKSRIKVLNLSRFTFIRIIVIAQLLDEHASVVAEEKQMMDMVVKCARKCCWLNDLLCRDL